jgi:membrane protease YdiL (CAAX protease family)
VFQHPAWVLTNIFFWVGLHPLLRLIVYPQWELKTFIHGMELLSAILLLLQGLSLWSLHGRPYGPWGLARSWRALPLLALIWFFNGLVLWLLTEFHLLQEPLLEPLYDNQLFMGRYPISWTTLSFLFSAVGEEIFFRAWLPDFLQKRWRRSVAIVASALLFTVAHLSLHTNAEAWLAYGLFALCLSYVRSMHGLAVAIGVHLLNNVIVVSRQVFDFQLLVDLTTHENMLYVLLFLLGAGVFLVGRDVLRMVDKGD